MTMVGTPAPDSRRRILDAAIDVIDAEGEAALRVTDIADRAKVAAGLINHHFGSRDGLVAEAQAERYSSVVGQDLANFTALLRADLPHEEIVGNVRAALSGVARRDRAGNRLRRLTALAGAHGRPGLRIALSQTVAMTVDRATEVITTGQEVGVFRADLNPRAAGTLMLCTALGYVVADFDARPVSEDDLVEVVGVLLDAFFLPAD
jgi:AcrR family transcriptional regulator